MFCVHALPACDAYTFISQLHLYSKEIYSCQCHSQAVSRRLPTEAARVRVQVRSCGICGGQSGTGACFLRLLRLPLPILIPPTTPHSSLSSGSDTIDQLCPAYQVDSVSPHPKKLEEKKMYTYLSEYMFP
jgi:hypothetical protein